VTDQAEEQSVEERMLAFVEAEEGLPEEESEPAAEAAEEVDEEQEQEDSEEEQPTATVKLKFNGEEIEKPLEEVVSLAQQGLDYTQKTQKLAEERREVETYAQTVKAQEQQFQQHVQVQQALIQEYASITALDQQIAHYQGVNWPAWSDNDPAEAQKAFFQFNQLQTQRGQMVAELQQKQNYITQQQAQSFQEQRTKLAETIRKEIPDYTPEKDRAMLETGIEYGFSKEELGTVVDPRHIKVLHDAMQWRKLQANPTANQKVSNAPPVVKPGSKNTKTAQASQSRQLQDQLKKTGKDEYARQLIERRL
jgi:hypothetical protein